jgi:hypothetical protein
LKDYLDWMLQETLDNIDRVLTEIDGMKKVLKERMAELRRSRAALDQGRPQPVS